MPSEPDPEWSKRPPDGPCQQGPWAWSGHLRGRLEDWPSGRPGRWWSGPRRGEALRRSDDDHVLGGVGAGIARRLGLDVTVVRLALVLSVLLSGIGLAAYVLAWLFVPLEGEGQAIASRAASDRRGLALALGLVPAVALALIIASSLGAGWLSTIAWPLLIAAGGMVLVWRNAGEVERARMGRVAGPLQSLGLLRRHSRRQLAARAATGVLLAGCGLWLLTHGHRVTGLIEPLGGVLLLTAGALVVFGPWWLNIARELVDERQARAVAEERADLAAKLHDSVLQTLALIQRQAGDPSQVVRLARAQERELRGWLLAGRIPGANGDADGSLAAAIEHLQRDVESLHGVPVEAVVVGDCPLDDDLRALVEAGREATVNAAKWSGAAEVSLYVEVEPDGVSMFVRDRGKGFDEADVAPDRRGVSESIRGRMARRGGTATIRSAPREGTEVALRMARR